MPEQRNGKEEPPDGDARKRQPRRLRRIAEPERRRRQNPGNIQRKKDAAAIQALPREKLNSGSSEIRNWICVAGAVEHLALEWSLYEPGYRTPAGTGTGLGFAFWS